MPERHLIFRNTGEDYSGFVSAILWLRDNGYSYGFMEKNNPIGIIKGKWMIQKWSRISENQKRILDGTIEFPYGDPRRHSVIVKIK